MNIELDFWKLRFHYPPCVIRACIGLRKRIATVNVECTFAILNPSRLKFKSMNNV